jgi:hypothetical protein
MGLYEKILGIENAIVNAVWGDLSGEINGILIDQRLKKGHQTPPYIHIFEEHSDIDDLTMALTEQWKLRITVMAVVAGWSGDDPTKAKELSIKSAVSLLKDRKLNGNAKDTVRTDWYPSYKKELPNGQFFGAAVGMEVRFLNREE